MVQQKKEMKKDRKRHIEFTKKRKMLRFFNHLHSLISLSFSSPVAPLVKEQVTVINTTK